MGFGILDILLILLIVTLIIGGRNLLDLPHAVVKSVKELKRRPLGQRLNPRDIRILITIHLGIMLFITIMTLALADVISAEQTTVVTAVVFVWLIVGFYCFGKRG